MSAVAQLGVCGDCGAEGLVVWCSCDRVLLCLGADAMSGCADSGHQEGCLAEAAIPDVLPPPWLL